MGKRHFVVERLNWRPYQEPGYKPGERARRKVGAFARLPGAERVASFEDRASAEEDCRQREQEARKGANPFAHGGPLCYQTSLDEGRLGDWVQDAGLTPPEPGAKGGWRDWWTRIEPTMSDLQRAKVWEALDKVRFFRVVETPKRVLFVVAAPYWRYNDEYHYTQPDGLTPYTAYRTREEAEADRAENEEFARHDMDWHPFHVNGLCDWEAWSSLLQEEAVARVKALGLPPPPGHDDTLDWENWWDSTEMDYEQADGVWDLLDKVHFWEVIEVEVPD